MKNKQRLRILLVEDNATEVLLVQESSRDLPGMTLDFRHTERLSSAIEILDEERFDAVLLDLGLPDSTGLDTFLRLRQAVRDVPVLVLTSLRDESVGEEAVQQGAQDFLVKSELPPFLLARSIRYAIERVEWQRTVEVVKQRESHERELRAIDAVCVLSGTEESVRRHSGQMLQQAVPDEFAKLVARYFRILELSFGRRLYKGEPETVAELRTFADDLGILYASARDVVEIHSTALRRKLKDLPAPKTQAFVEESRFAMLQLMGYLLGYYRNAHPRSVAKESSP